MLRNRSSIQLRKGLLRIHTRAVIETVVREESATGYGIGHLWSEHYLDTES